MKPVSYEADKRVLFPSLVSAIFGLVGLKIADHWASGFQCQTLHARTWRTHGRKKGFKWRHLCRLIVFYPSRFWHILVLIVFCYLSQRYYSVIFMIFLIEIAQNVCNGIEQNLIFHIHIMKYYVSNHSIRGATTCCDFEMSISAVLYFALGKNTELFELMHKILHFRLLNNIYV